MKREKLQYYTPKKGNMHNPILKYRNMSCICGSGKKVKRCCGQFIYVSNEWGRWATEFLRYVYDKTGTVKPPLAYNKAMEILT